MIAPKRRWLRFSLRTLFVMVTVFGLGLGWIGWNLKQVRNRNAFIDYLKRLDQRSGSDPYWEIRCHEERLPIVWRMLGAQHDWADWLVQSAALTDAELQRAKLLLPDCDISVNGG